VRPGAGELEGRFRERADKFRISEKIQSPIADLVHHHPGTQQAGSRSAVGAEVLEIRKGKCLRMPSFATRNNQPCRWFPGGSDRNASTRRPSQVEAGQFLVFITAITASRRTSREVFPTSRKGRVAANHCCFLFASHIFSCCSRGAASACGF